MAVALRVYVWGVGDICIWASSYTGLWNNHYIKSSIYVCRIVALNSSDYAASYTGSSIKGVNMETCLHFIMNNLSYILLAARKCDGQHGAAQGHIDFNCDWHLKAFLPGWQRKCPLCLACPAAHNEAFKEKWAVIS